VSDVGGFEIKLPPWFLAHVHVMFSLVSVSEEENLKKELTETPILMLNV
jgi:hypothetical protein